MKPAGNSCGYCYERPNGSVGRCILDDCMTCCACGRHLRLEREDGISGGVEVVKAFTGWSETPDIWCNGKVCGWYPCECGPGE